MGLVLLGAALKITHRPPDQTIPFDKIFHLVIGRAFAAGESELQIARSLTGDAHCLQKWIGKIDKRLLRKRSPSALRFHDDSGDGRFRRLCCAKKFASRFFRYVRVDPHLDRVIGKPLSLDIGPAAVVAGDGSVWVAKSYFYCKLHNPIPEGPPILFTELFRLDPELYESLAAQEREILVDRLVNKRGYPWETPK